MSIKELFAVAVHGATKEERRNAYREIRRLSLYGEGEEQAEAALCLNHSHLYQVHAGDMAELTKIISKLSLAPGITKQTADKETARLKELFSEMAEQLDVVSSTSNQ
jgi:hypothetical protein